MPASDISRLPAADPDVLFVENVLPVSEAVGACRRLRWIHTGSSGYDHVTGGHGAPEGIVLTNSAGVFDAGIAEWVLLVLLADAKDLLGTVRLQRQRRWNHRDSRLLAGSSALVVGAGSVGTTVAAHLAAAQVRVTGVARRARTSAPPFDAIVAVEDMDAQLGTADAVVLCLPLTEETRGAFHSGRFANMRPGAAFVNVGRGEVVVEEDLVAALAAGIVGFAALDVFRQEPLPPESPLWAQPGVIVSPHMSGDAGAWRERVTDLFLENLGAWLQGRPLRNVVSPDRAPGAAATSG